MTTTDDSPPRHTGLKALAVLFRRRSLVVFSFFEETARGRPLGAALHYTGVSRKDKKLNPDQADSVTLVLAGPRGRLAGLS